jgi:sulfite reductase (NADPH) flavoprotein alpha-component
MRGFPAAQLVTIVLLLVLATIAGLLWWWQPGTLQWSAPADRRIVLALIAAAAYLLLCGAIVRHHCAGSSAADRSAQWLVVHASQTGVAEQLATQTVEALRRAGVSAQLIPLGALDSTRLNAARQALFIVSTTGEGDAPDAALKFLRNVMPLKSSLKLEYALLALGDRHYHQFCAWGRRLDAWLRNNGATPLFERIEVDGVEHSALARWQQQIAALTGANSWQAQTLQHWTLSGRRLANPGSQGAPCWSVELTPPPQTRWQAGDVLTIEFPGEPAARRDYSMASLPDEGGAQLLVRESRRPDGGPGVGSGWLSRAPLGAQVPAQIRRNRGFHVPDDQRPLILIGNGTGIAGLRALLRERLSRGFGDNWLVFGERQQACDFHYGDELKAWQASGLLTLDTVFSRDGDRSAARRYVQDRLHERATLLREWVERGASIYVCGSAQGMATGVDAALREILGTTVVDRLLDDGRYRRDVY